MRQALDGILHFDVAGAYRLVAAPPKLEASLGRVRKNVTIATKFGVAPRPWVRPPARSLAPGRAVIARSASHNPGLSTQARGRGVSVAGLLLYRSTGYTGVHAIRSITASRRHLQGRLHRYTSSGRPRVGDRHRWDSRRDARRRRAWLGASVGASGRSRQ